MAELGFRTVEEMVGRTDVLQVSERAKDHWKANSLIYRPFLYPSRKDHVRSKHRKIIKSKNPWICTEILPAVDSMPLRKEVKWSYISQSEYVNRVVGTIVGSEISKQYGEEGLPEDTITLRFTGSAGQSFGAFIPKGMSMYLTGDANDYFGKGLSGGKLVVTSTWKFSCEAEENVIAGNVALYGATSGEAYINGRAGERFAVRNSGVDVVVEGIGDHGCEYMTGGRVVILGDVGKNFAAGMSGGIAYVLADEVRRI